MNIAGTSGWLFNGGTIKNGTVTGSGGASFLVNSGTLDGVTLTSDPTVKNGATLNVKNEPRLHCLRPLSPLRAPFVRCGEKDA